MARIIVTPGASRGLERCRHFLQDKSPLAARRAAEAIRRQLQTLAAFPESGRPHEDAAMLREVVIPFGESGYVLLYRYEPAEDTVYLLAFRHQREAGY